jgi:hypothetical protein
MDEKAHSGGGGGGGISSYHIVCAAYVRGVVSTTPYLTVPSNLASKDTHAPE